MVEKKRRSISFKHFCLNLTLYINEFCMLLSAYIVFMTFSKLIFNTLFSANLKEVNDVT